jgi:hypothetical protein
MVLVAVEQHTPAAQRLVEDSLAVRLLPARSRLVVAACGRRAVRTQLIRASERQVPGLWGSTLCRKRYERSRGGAPALGSKGAITRSVAVHRRQDVQRPYGSRPAPSRKGVTSQPHVL